MTAVNGFNRMIEGYRRFRDKDWAAQHDRWETLSAGQSPRIMVIACSDSRVDPARIFDTPPGEIFVVRNVANLVPPYEAGDCQHDIAAALEFAVTQLNVPEIVVIGHGDCGGVHASLSRQFEGKALGEGGFIAHWIDMLDEARNRVVKEYGSGPEAVHALELETVRLSIANLRSFPFIRARETAGSLQLHGAYFRIADGVLHVMDQNGAFRPA